MPSRKPRLSRSRGGAAEFHRGRSDSASPKVAVEPKIPKIRLSIKESPSCNSIRALLYWGAIFRLLGHFNKHGAMETILRYIESNRSRYLEELKELIKIARFIGLDVAEDCFHSPVFEEV